MSKYNNRKTVCFLGHKHDSRKEAGVCSDYYLEKKAGTIVDYQVAPVIRLQEKFKGWDGKSVRAITYIPDFIVFRDGYTEFVDVKSKPTITTAFKIKWKLLQKMYQNETRYRFLLHI